jgi:hypothetical protein
MDGWGNWQLAVAERHDDNRPAFQCRVGGENIPSPGGTAEVCRMKWKDMAGTSFCRPGGTCAGADEYPALKRRAIVRSFEDVVKLAQAAAVLVLVY